MKELGIIYVIVQILFLIFAYYNMNLPEGILITIIPAIIVAVILRKIFFGKIT